MRAGASRQEGEKEKHSDDYTEEPHPLRSHEVTCCAGETFAFSTHGIKKTKGLAGYIMAQTSRARSTGLKQTDSERQREGEREGGKERERGACTSEYAAV